MALIDAPARATTAPPLDSGPSCALAAPKRVVVWLSPAAAALAGFATNVGIFSQGGPGAYAFTTVRGETAQMFGHGIYCFDTLFRAVCGVIEQGGSGSGGRSRRRPGR